MTERGGKKGSSLSVLEEGKKGGELSLFRKKSGRFRVSKPLTGGDRKRTKEKLPIYHSH